jgi:hypothetical protein
VGAEDEEEEEVLRRVEGEINPIKKVSLKFSQ